MIYAAGIHAFLLTKKGQITAGSPSYPFAAGLTGEGSFQINTAKDGTDDRDRNLRNMMQFEAAFKTRQILLEDLKTFVSIYCADHGVDAQVVFLPKNGGGYNKAWNFHDTGLNDTYFAGFNFDFTLSDQMRECSVMLKTAVEYGFGKQLVDLLYTTQIHPWLLDTNNGLGSKGVKFSKEKAPYWIGIEHPSGSSMLSKPDLKSRRLSIKTSGNVTAFERQINDWIEVEFEVVFHDVSDESIWRIVNRAQESSLKLVEQVSETKTEQYIFNEGAITFKPVLRRAHDTAETTILAKAKFPPAAVSFDVSDANNVKMIFNP